MGELMKRVAALAVISLAFLSACSSDSDNGAKPSDGTDNSTAMADAREYTMTDGSKVTFDRLAPLPENMMKDVQSRFDAVLYEPDVKAYEAAAATMEGAGPDVDNVMAFKGEATKLGSETGKYYGGVVRGVTQCDDASVVTWGFIAQDATTPKFAACDSADAKAEATDIANKYIVGALGGPEAWVIVTQNSDK
ncbi:hypothetical protein [Timonella senegalensis]|uniref:hypothetical protein n=2 Tax=Timonella senegalensis TaxID=1465825 RepID=UPI0028A8C5BB|nr:hypothetical protein [Timonella senegalensis]